MSDIDSIRAELRSIRNQESHWLSKHELRALNRRARDLITKAGLLGMAPAAYQHWLDGASLEAARSLSSQANPQAAPSPPSRPSSRDTAPARAAPPSPPIRNMIMIETAAQAAPRPSRAAEVAEIHLAGINLSRKRAGLAPLTSAELAHEFADVDRTPARSSGMTHRARGNAIAARQGTPTTQGAIDDMWADIARRGNASAGLKTPARTHG